MPHVGVREEPAISASSNSLRIDSVDAQPLPQLATAQKAREASRRRDRVRNSG